MTEVGVNPSRVFVGIDRAGVPRRLNVELMAFSVGLGLLSFPSFLFDPSSPILLTYPLMVPTIPTPDSRTSTRNKSNPP